jgi:hypothetical protein
MASAELLRLRAFARGDRVENQDPAVVNNYLARVNRSLVDTSAWICARSAETIRTCRVTLRESHVILDRARAVREVLTG